MQVSFEALNVAMMDSMPVIQVAEAAAKMEPWQNALFGAGIVMTALGGIWFMTSLVGTFFAKQDAARKAQAAAAPKPVAAAPAAAAPANDIPLAVIIAAAVAAVGGQVRNVTVQVPGKESVTWTSQGRQAIYASHSAKAPLNVTSLGSIRQS